MWAQACQNYRTHKPKPKVEYFYFGAKPHATTGTVDDSKSILNLPLNFTREQLKDAYRAAAKIHHPDHGGTAEGFRRVTEAYQRLMSSMGGSSRVVIMLLVLLGTWSPPVFCSNIAVVWAEI